MIEIGKFIDSDIPQFSLLNDGFYPKGYVLMECRLSDLDGEPDALFIDITTDMVEVTRDKYHYSTLALDKGELKQFIEFLQARYDKLPDR